MRYSKHEVITINILYSLKKYCRITPPPPLNGHFFTTATFFCLRGGRCAGGSTFTSKFLVNRF